MNKIWIRSEIPKINSIIIVIISIMFAVIIWITLTTLRHPPSNIAKNIFNEKIINNTDIYEDDKKIMRDYYIYNTDMDVFKIKSGLINKEIYLINEILIRSEIVKNFLPNPIFSPNVLPHPLDIIKCIPNLIKGSNESSSKFIWKKSLLYAVWVSLKRELFSFLIVIITAIPLGIAMSCNNKIRSFFTSGLVMGTYIPIAALIPLTLAFFGIGEIQKIFFLTLSMFFVLLGLVIKEIDEVDQIYLNTSYTLGFKQWQSIIFVIFPAALPRIWKQLQAVFGLGWGYIIFAEMINTGGGEIVNGIGWLFIARQRRFKVDEMYAIFLIIILLAFLFSYLFKLGYWLIFKYERNKQK